MILVTIDKFDPNPILVNINKLKPYTFLKDHTFQPILVKPNVLLLEEPVETNHYGNLFTKESVETNHFGNLFVEDLIGTHHFGDLFTKNLARIYQFSKIFIKELIKFQTKDMLVKYLVET